MNWQAWSSMLLRIAFSSASYLSMTKYLKKKERKKKDAQLSVCFNQFKCEKLTSDIQR